MTDNYSSKAKKEGVIKVLKKRFTNLKSHNQMKLVMDSFYADDHKDQVKRPSWSICANYIQKNWDAWMKYLYDNNNEIKKL
jgi:hypothetical protein